jgi:hypothetical protein
MPIKPTLLSLLRHTQAELNAFAAGLPAVERDAPSDWQRWSARDALGHAALWVDHLSDDLLTPPVESGEFDLEAINRQVFERFCDQPFAEVWAFTHAAFDRQIAVIESLTEEQLSDPQQYAFMGGPVWRYVIGNSHTHPVMHLAGYWVERGQPERGAELYRLSAERLAEIDPSPDWQAIVTYNMACAFAFLNDHAAALDRLRLALQDNPRLREWAREDPDLINLRGDPDFEALTAAA